MPFGRDGSTSSLSTRSIGSRAAARIEPPQADQPATIERQSLRAGFCPDNCPGRDTIADRAAAAADPAVTCGSATRRGGRPVRRSLGRTDARLLCRLADKLLKSPRSRLSDRAQELQRQTRISGLTNHARSQSRHCLSDEAPPPRPRALFRQRREPIRLGKLRMEHGRQLANASAGAAAFLRSGRRGSRASPATIRAARRSRVCIPLSC